MVDADFLMRKFKEEEDDLIKLTQELVKIPSVNPPGDMTEITGFLRDYFNDAGLNYEAYEPEKGVITLYLKSGRDEEHDFLHFNGHIDVVPIGERSKWTVDPFGGEIIDGYLYGRGSSDMKAGVAATIKVFEILTRYWEGLPRRIGLSLVPDEETGGRLGTRYLIDKVGIRPKYVVIGEPSTSFRLEIGEKGVYNITIRVEGFPAHASLSPHVGDNAIMKVLKIGDEIYKLSEKTVDVPEKLKDVVENSGFIVAQYFKKPSLSRLYKSLSINVGMIRGGDKINIVPSWAEIDVDIRIPHGWTKDDVRKMVEDILAKYDGSAKIISDRGENPSYTDPDSPIIQSILEASKDVMGFEVTKHLVAGATDGRFFRKVGSDAVIYGPGEPGRIHSYDERVSVDDIKKVGEVLLKASYNLISSNPF